MASIYVNISFGKKNFSTFNAFVILYIYIFYSIIYVWTTSKQNNNKMYIYLYIFSDIMKNSTANSFCPYILSVPQARLLLFMYMLLVHFPRNKYYCVWNEFYDSPSFFFIFTTKEYTYSVHLWIKIFYSRKRKKKLCDTLFA